MMEVCFDEDPSRWDAFVATSPHRSIFVKWSFLRALGTPYALVTLRDGDRIVAGLPVALDDAGRPFSVAHPFTMYQGLLHAGRSAIQPHRRVTEDIAAVEILIAALLSRYDRCCLCQSWRFQDIRGFLWWHYHEPEKGHFTVNIQHTGILDLEPYASFEAYLAEVRTLRRREYRRARTAEVTMQDLTDIEVLDTLHAKTFARQGLERSTDEVRIMRSIAREAIDVGFGTLRCALVDGKPASALLFLYDDRTAYYLIGANDPEYRDTGASTFLMLEMIRDAMARGLREVDFVGVNSPARGDYKVSLNADVHPYVMLRYGV